MQFSVSDRHDRIIEQIRKAVDEHDLLPEGAHVVLGLSGGPDSVCLFHVLRMLAEEKNLSLHAVHINHQLRGDAADQDQEFVENLCLSTGVPLDVIVFDCARLAKDMNITTEEAGRIKRYEAFDDTADRILRDEPDADVRIAVAHNYDDQAETIMFRLMRGTGPDGLAGMEYIREDERGHYLIRPLLDCPKKDIVRFLMKEKLDARLDETNEEAIYSRNVIRLDIFPYLEKYAPNFRDALVRLGNVAREDKALMRSLAEQVMEYAVTENGDGYIMFDRKKLSKIAIPVRRRVLSLSASALGLAEDLTQAHFNAADDVLLNGGPSAGVDLPHGYRVSNVYEQIRIAAPDESGKAAPPGKVFIISKEDYDNMLPKHDENSKEDETDRSEYSDNEEGSGRQTGDTGSVDNNGDNAGGYREPGKDTNGASKQRTTDVETLKAGRYAAFDADALELRFGKGGADNAKWRRRESGEYMEISASRRDSFADRNEEEKVALKLGLTSSEQDRPLTKKLQDIFVDGKIPKDDREKIYFAAIGNEVLFIPEQQEFPRARWSTGYKVTQGTKRVLLFTI